MSFTNVCRCWRVIDCPASPRELLTSMLQVAVRRLPSNSLGHAKGYAQYAGGALFASTTVVPPDIGVQEQGEFQGGDVEINLVLIFSDLDQEVLEEAVAAAREHARGQWGCGFQEIQGEIDAPQGSLWSEAGRKAR